jgi:arylsulfatase A-like enzyme
LLARRLVERGVRFVQLYHRGWDHHGGPDGNLVFDLKKRCLETDQPAVALIRDLKERGLLDSTLVIWGGEFGRTPMMQGALKPDQIGRDHHPHGYTIWMAGGGIKPGMVYGKTDEFGFYAVDGRVHVHDLHATILHLFGIEHTQLTYRFQGRDFRLTDVHGELVKPILA